MYQVNITVVFLFVVCVWAFYYANLYRTFHFKFSFGFVLICYYTFNVISEVSLLISITHITKHCVLATWFPVFRSNMIYWSLKIQLSSSICNDAMYNINCSRCLCSIFNLFCLWLLIIGARHILLWLQEPIPWICTYYSIIMGRQFWQSWYLQ